MTVEFASRIVKTCLLIFLLANIGSCLSTENENFTEIDFSNPPQKLISEIDNYALHTFEEYLEVTILGFQKGRSLTALEKEYAKKIGIPDPENIRIVETDDFTPLSNKLRNLQKLLNTEKSVRKPNAVQLYKTILINIDASDKEETIQHELVHVLQDIRMGLIEKIRFHQLELRFLGYEGSTLEQEAFNHP